MVLLLPWLPNDDMNTINVRKTTKGVPIYLLLSILYPIQVLCVLVNMYGISYAGGWDVNTVVIAE
jgi:hypothetical protein